MLESAAIACEVIADGQRHPGAVPLALLATGAGAGERVQRR